jgi:MoaA/NifB/PqqE/SkfB family radical SAM enzyme
MKDKKYFCYEIYKNLAIRSLNGQIGYSPCSYYDGVIKITTDFDLSKAWHSPEHNQLKLLIENDQPIPGCHQCYREESHGLASRWKSSKQLYEDFHQDTNIDLTSPQSIDYSVGNLCNLKCLICGPENSSSWLPDYQKKYPLTDINKFKYDKHNQIETLDLALLMNVKNIHFHGGGEPLMSNNHVTMLKSIKEAKGLSDVRVFYNTNGTQTVSLSVLDLWEECKLVELYFSIDDIGDRFNYQRTGANWNQVIQNIKWFVNNMPHNHMFNINCAWGYLNLYYLDEIEDWYQNNLTKNRYGDTVNLIYQKVIGDFSINHVSKPTKEVLLNKFSNRPRLIELVNSLTTSAESNSFFWEKINQIDSIRGNSFRSVCPEWAELLD